MTDATPPTNQWIHLVGTFDGTTARIYLDNVKGTDGTTLTSTTLYSASSNLEIGGSSGLAMFTDGLIDEVAIWDVALANNERDYLYNNGKPGNISSLQPLGWWRMGDDNSIMEQALPSPILEAEETTEQSTEQLFNRYSIKIIIMSLDDINYKGQRLDDKHFKIKFKTGEDIYNARDAAIGGEMFLANGG